jgi:lysophospholipase L1-like esterase
MKKILLYGDSITDAGWDRNAPLGALSRYGYGYANAIAGELLVNDGDVQVINNGISGNRIVDLYARIKVDVWNHEPDVLSILIGVNDVWHEIFAKNGVEIDRFERIYRMLIDDTLKVLPNVKIILMEPFVLKGTATEENYEQFLKVREYAKVVKKIAQDYGFAFLPLQDKFDKGEKEISAEHYLSDGVHPSIAGARLIANEWLKLYNEKIK